MVLMGILWIPVIQGMQGAQQFCATLYILTLIIAPPCTLCVQYIRVCDGVGGHPVDPSDPGHARCPAVLLHPGRQCLLGSSHCQCLPVGRALASRQRTGNSR